MIGYWHHTVVCLSVPSVTLCTVVLRLEKLYRHVRVNRVPTSIHFFRLPEVRKHSERLKSRQASAAANLLLKIGDESVNKL